MTRALIKLPVKDIAFIGRLTDTLEVSIQSSFIPTLHPKRPCCAV